MVLQSQLGSWLHNKMDTRVGLWGMKRAGIGANMSMSTGLSSSASSVPLSRFLEQGFSNDQR